MTSAENVLFEFVENNSLPEENKNLVKILTVEDDINYQNALINSFKALTLDDGIQLDILTAHSVTEAALVLARNSDIALVFIDVVMEDDDSGLRLVDTIRNVIGNREMRIVLLTGQPSFAPERKVMESLDIDEYWNKSDITIEKLHSIVNSNLRTYNYIVQISAAKHGLQLVLDAARSINSKHDIESFSSAVLDEITNILNISEGGGVLCSGNTQHFEVAPKVITTSGCFRGLEGQFLTAKSLDDEIYQAVKKSIHTKTHVFSPHHTVFYFETPNFDNNHYITIVKSDNPISQQNIYLLQVFSENVSTGFSNIALLNRLTELAYTDVALNMPNRNWLQREIENMNASEQQKTLLLVFEILQFDEKSFSFGYEFCNKTLKRLQLNIQQQLASYSPRIALFKNDSLGVLIANDPPLSDSVIDSFNRQAFVADGVLQIMDVRVLAVDLNSVLQNNASQIFNLAESTLNEANINLAEFIRFTPANTQALTRRFDLMLKLRSAIRNNELMIALQPKVNLNSHKVVGFEALARWQLADGTFISPDEFIELAETAGLISVLDKLIFDKILEATNVLNCHGYCLPIAFNASTSDLLSDQYFVEMTEKIAKYGVSPQQLELEVTETQAIFNYEKVNKTLHKFAKLGIKISIDDFGTGYSSLQHIAQIPAHAIKIDRCFVSNLQNNESNEHIINMIMMLADTFGFEVIAEGVENKYEQEWLSNIGCRIAQGYLFAKPMFMDDLLVWLKNNEKLHGK